MANELRSSPIGLACLHGRLEEVELLLRESAETDVVLNGHLLLKKVQKSTVAIVLEQNGNTSSHTRLMTPLWIAAANGHGDIVDKLLDKGANVDFKNEVGATPLFISALNGHEKVVKLLVAARADLDCSNDKGQTALYAAAANGHSNIVRVLVHANARSDIKNNSGRSALDAAIRNGHQDSVRLLKDAIACRASPRFVTNDTADMTPVTQRFVQIKNGEVGEGKNQSCDLVPHDDLEGSMNCKDNDKVAVPSSDNMDRPSVTGSDSSGNQESGSVGVPSSRGPKEVAKDDIAALGQSLLSLFPGAVTNPGQTPLFAAAVSGQAAIVASLLAQGAEIDTQVMANLGADIGTKEVTALWASAALGHEEVVGLLIRNGANVNYKTKGEESPVFIASYKGHCQVVKRLVEAKADITGITRSGLSALFIAALQGHTDVVRLLLPCTDESFINLTNNQGHTALIAAASNGHRQIVDLLLSFNAEVYTIDQNGRTAIFAGACLGDAGVVESLLKFGANVHIIDKTGRSALFAALSNGHRHAAELLLSANAEINVVDFQGITPLHATACNGHKEALDLILSFNVNVNSTCNVGRTPLFYASFNGQGETVKRLIDSGADLNVRDYDCHSALHVAVMNGHRKVVKLLLEAGADVNTRDNGIRSILFLVSHHGNTEMAELLIKAGADLAAEDDEGHQPLFAATYNGHARIVDLLIEAGADVDHRDKEERTALYVTSERGHADIAEKLILCGADVNCTDFEGYSPLIAAALNNQVEVAARLTHAGANVDTQNKDGRTALFSSSQDGFREFVALLLAYKANVHLKDNVGVDALISACYGGHYEIAQMLIESKADVNTADLKGRTPLLVATQEGHPKIVELLIKHNADQSTRYSEGHTLLHHAAYFGQRQTADVLIASGLNIESKNDEEFTPLTLACVNGHLDVVKLLISAKANLEAKDISGHTPLHIAACEGHEPVVRFLIEAGANVNSRRNDDCSSLHAVAQQGHIKIAKMLLEAKADCNVRNDKGYSPLYPATISDHKDIVELILKKGNIERDEIHKVLPIAAACGLVKTVGILTSAVANRTQNLDETSNDVGNSLIVAAFNGQLETVKLLLENGVDINFRNRQGHTALHAASYKVHPGIAKMLISSGAKTGLQDVDGNSALILASIAGSVEIVQMLADAGEEIGLTNVHERSALHLASTEGHHELVRTLLERGACVNSVDYRGQSALSLAAENGHINVVICLLSYRALLDLTDTGGSTALMMAAATDHPDIVDLLISAGASINPVSKKRGTSALIVAANKGHFAVAEVLVKAGAALDLTDENGACATFAAAASGQDEVLKLLIESGANLRLLQNDGVTVFEASLRGACYSDHGGTIRILLSLDHVRDITDACVLRVLIWSIREEKLDTLQILFRYYVSHHLKNVKSVTRDPQILSLIYSSFFGMLLDAIRSARSPDVYRAIQLLASEDPALHCPDLRANLPFQDVIDYSFLNAAAISDPRRRLVQVNNFSEDLYRPFPRLSVLVKTPGLGNVLSIPGEQARVVFSHVKSVVEEIVYKVKSNKFGGLGKMDNAQGVGSAGEGTNVGLPDEMDFVVQYWVNYSEVLVEELDHGYKFCNIKPDSEILTAEKAGFARDFCSGSKHFHNGFVERLFSADVMKHPMIDTPLNFVKGGGHASTELHIRWAEPDSKKPFLVSVDMVPVLHFPNAWPCDAIQETWLMDTDTLRSRGFALVAKPPHRNSPMGQALGELKCSKLWRLSCSHLETEHIASLDPRVKDAYIAAKCVRNPDVCRIVVKDANGIIRNVDKYVTSYLLKTVFLHNVPDFLTSRKSLVCMLYTIYSELVRYLRIGFLPLFWQRNANTLEGLSIDIKKSLRVAELMKQFVQQLYLREEVEEVDGEFEGEVVVYNRDNSAEFGYMAFTDDPNYHQVLDDEYEEQIIYIRDGSYTAMKIYDFLKGEDGY